MTPEQFEELKISLNDQVKITVNGKIDRLSIKLENYITSDNEWKEKAQPSIDLGNNTRTIGRFFAGMFGTIGVISGAIFGVWELIKRIKGQ